jgi:hypothetical protein
MIIRPGIFLGFFMHLKVLIYNESNIIMNISQAKSFFNRKPVEFILKEAYNDLKEDREFIPRFSLKNIKDFQDVPINEPIKYDEKLVIKAIQYGMIFLINYKGEKDKHFAGHERVIYPMVLGRSSKGKPLIRGWHLNGWSVSKNRHINKIWRLFRADRILSMTFTGSFYRLAPVGYNMDDKGMRGGIIAKADFNAIRRNQQNLVQQNVIQNREEVTLSQDERKFVTIRAKITDSKLDLNTPLENAYINNLKNVENVRISFLKSIYGNQYIAILGAMGEPGNTVKVLDDKGKNLGVYKVLDSTTGQVLKSIKKVKGNSIYDLYIFDKKI